MIRQYEKILPLFDYAKFCSGDVNPTVTDMNTFEEIFYYLNDFRLTLEEHEGTSELQGAIDSCKVERQATLLKSKVVFALVTHNPTSFTEEAAQNPEAHDEYLEEHLQLGSEREYEARNEIADEAKANLEEMRKLGERTVAVLRQYADIMDRLIDV